MNLKKLVRRASHIQIKKRTWIALWIIALVLPISIKLFLKPNQAEADWWNPSWMYRKSIPITYSGSENLTEYQVLVELDTATMVTDGKLQSDCDDLRFVSRSGSVLDYSIVGATCNTTDTQIWVKTDSIPGSDINIQMYYGNSSAPRFQDEAKTFSYSEEKDVGYILDDEVDQLEVISLTDNNSISHNNNTLSLGKYAAGQFTSVNQWGAISAKGLFNAEDETGGTDMTVPISWAGTEFLFYQRYDTLYLYAIAPWQQATITVYQDGVAVGDCTSQTIATTGTALVCSSVANGSILITSDYPVITFSAPNSGGGDERPLAPSHVGPWIGGGQSSFMTANASGASYNYTYDTNSGSALTGSISAHSSASFSGDSSYGGGGLLGWSDDYPVTMSQQGDGDGGDGHFFTLLSEMGSVWGSAVSNTDYISISSDQAATCTVYDSNKTQLGQTTLTSSNSSVYWGGFDTGNSDTWTTEDWHMECDAPVATHFQKNGSYESGLWTYPMMRQFTYPTPAVGTMASEEVSTAGPVAYWKFDEGYGTTASDSAGDNDGTITGATWTSEDQCVSGKCLEFNGGTSQISVANDKSLDQTSAMSISMWIKPTTIDDNITLLNRSTITSDNGLSFELHSGKPTLIINNGRVSGEVQMCDQTITVNQFTHLIWSRDDSNNNHIFINGTECTYSSTISQTQTSATTTLGIGSKLGKQNIITYPDYSNRTYEQAYTASGWSGDEATIYYYGNDGKNNLPYKKLSKTVGGTGGAYLDDNEDFTIENNHNYVISAWLKASQNINDVSYHILNINRNSDNAYRSSGINYDLTTQWQRYSWVYNAGADHYGTDYQSRHIIYVDNNLPIDFYWAGFQVEDVTGTGFTDPSINFKGYIDEVKIYPFAISEDQVRQDYNNGAAVVLGAQDQGPLSDGLVGYWKMDEASCNPADSTGLNSNFTCINTPTAGSGKFGNATQFESTTTQYLSLADNSNISVGNVTLSAWAYIDSQTGTYQVVAWKGADYEISMDSSLNPRFGVHTGTRTAVTTSGHAMSTGRWYHLVLTYDGSKMKGYLDGALIFEQAPDQIDDIIDGSSEFNVSDDTWPIDGRVDEVRIYNRALSAREVTDLYHYAPGPVGYWKFDEGSGTTANDSSGNGNDGSFYNSPEYVTGKFGKALKFERANDEWLIVNDNDSIDVIGSITTMAWVKTSITSGDHMAMFNKGGFGVYDTRYSSFIYPTGDIKNSVNDGSGSVEDDTISSNVNNGNWHHVATVVDKESEKIYYYIDGNILGSDDLSMLGSYENSANLIIGGGNASRDFEGLIDEAKIYNYVRTPQQIVQDMNAGHPTGGSPVGSQLAYWKFDEGYGTTAHTSVGNADFTTFSTPTWEKEGKVNGSLFFNGDDYIQTPSESSLQVSTELTISSWIKPTSYPITNTAFFVGRYYEYGFYLNSSGSLQAQIRNTIPEYEYFNSNTIIPLNEWSHVSLTFSNGSIKFYVNGELVKTDTLATSDIYNHSGNPVTNIIGSYYNTTSNFFSGYIDEVKIYSSALTADQIKLDMNAGSGVVYGVASNEADDLTDGAGNDPIAEWKLDEKTGTSANDTSGSNSIGTITGATWKSSAECKEGACLSFDGDGDYISLSSLPTITAPYTIEAWINPQQLGDYNTIISLRGSNSYPVFQIHGNDKLLAYAGPEKYQYGSRVFTSNDLNKWWHVAFVIADSASLTDWKIYVNGIEETGVGGANTGDYYEPSTIGTIGRGTGSNYFDGLIDQVKIYDYARTPAQIMYDYNRGKPVAHWKMDECQGTTINDSSGNGNSGTLNIGATGTQTSVGTCSTSGAWSDGATGKYSSSMSFDGTDDVITINNPSNGTLDINENTSLSMAAWVKTTDTSGTYHAIIEKGGYGSIENRYSLFYYGSNGTLRLYISDNVTSQNIPSNGSINDGNWHHIVAIVDRSSTKIRIYIDGSLDKEVDLTTTGSYASGDAMHIGGPSPFYSNGQIDDVRIYNYALSADQVKKVMNEGSGVRFGD